MGIGCSSSNMTAKHVQKARRQTLQEPCVDLGILEFHQPSLIRSLLVETTSSPARMAVIHSHCRRLPEIRPPGQLDTPSSYDQTWRGTSPEE